MESNDQLKDEQRKYGPWTGEEVYAFYRQYEEDSRTELLRLAVTEDARRRIREDLIVMPFQDLIGRLDIMTEESRVNFVRRLAMGYEFSRMVNDDANFVKSLRSHFGG